MTNIEIMAKAREDLKGKWRLCAGVAFVYILITAGLSNIPGIGPVFAILLNGPMMLGISAFFLDIGRKKDAEFSDIFDGFSRFGISFIAYLLVMVFFILWCLLLIVPGIIAALSYSMTFYIIADEPYISALDAIRKSKRMMEGHKLKLFYLGCRFIGWFLLCIVSLGIGLFWFIPYMNASFALFYEDIKHTA